MQCMARHSLTCTPSPIIVCPSPFYPGAPLVAVAGYRESEMEIPLILLPEEEKKRPMQ
jgi:hypothetical protein